MLQFSPKLHSLMNTPLMFTHFYPYSFTQLTCYAIESKNMTMMIILWLSGDLMIHRQFTRAFTITTHSSLLYV